MLFVLLLLPQVKMSCKFTGLLLLVLLCGAATVSFAQPKHDDHDDHDDHSGHSHAHSPAKAPAPTKASMSQSSPAPAAVKCTPFGEVPACKFS
jgi:hypothetical protein